MATHSRMRSSFWGMKLSKGGYPTISSNILALYQLKVLKCYTEGAVPCSPNSIYLLASPSVTSRKSRGLERPRGNEFGGAVRSSRLPQSRQPSPGSFRDPVPGTRMRMEGQGTWELAGSRNVLMWLQHHQSSACLDFLGDLYEIDVMSSYYLRRRCYPCVGLGRSLVSMRRGEILQPQLTPMCNTVSMDIR